MKACDNAERLFFHILYFSLSYKLNETKRERDELRSDVLNLNTHHSDAQIRAFMVTNLKDKICNRIAAIGGFALWK